MSLIAKIVNYLKTHEGEIPLSKIYATFNKEKKSTIRGRINEAVKAKKYIVRTRKGQYMFVGDEVDALIEQRDTRGAIFDILRANLYYDMIFLDIPYKTGGQKGGNRNLSDYNMLEAEEFYEMLLEMEKMLKSEQSQIYFMIAGGKSSKRDADKYIRAFDNTALRLAATGSYTKLNKNGTQCNMGKYLMPPEKILVYSPNGKLLKPEESVLDFRLQRPPLPKSGGYPTQKPYALLEQIIKQATNIGDRILDPFVGSGKIISAALKLGRKIHGLEISNEAMPFILKELQAAQKTLNVQKQICFASSDNATTQTPNLFSIAA